MIVSTTALLFAGLESAKLLLQQFPSYDQRKREEFERDYEYYIEQKTLPYDHVRRNDSLFIRVRHRLFEHVKEINGFVNSRSQTKEHVPTSR